MGLQELWFCLIAVLWTGYFVLEGFDFGVGMLLPVLGRNAEERGTMLESIGPVWDGNEVWLLVAGGATFAAFPLWYATMFSGFYVALLLVLVLLIARVVSFEWRGKLEDPRWSGLWTWANTTASVGAPLIWGIALSSLLYGVPLNSDHGFAGSFWDLFTWYSVLSGVAVVLLFALHGAAFLTLRTTGELRERARAAAARLALVAAVVGAAFLVATLVVGMDNNDKDLFPGIVVAVLAAVAAVAAVLLTRAGRDGQAFMATAATIVLAVVSLFTMLYPRVMVSSTGFGNSLTLDNAASGHYTLTVMTVAALVLLPIVLLYQAWTYHVFRARLGQAEMPAGPADMLGPRRGDD
jgi:cytochrome d ubiquinol oxidase subunit II